MGTLNLSKRFMLRAFCVCEAEKIIIIIINFQIEVSRMRKVEVKTTPDIVGALGTIEENCRKEL